MALIIVKWKIDIEGKTFIDANDVLSYRDSLRPPEQTAALAALNAEYFQSINYMWYPTEMIFTVIKVMDDTTKLPEFDAKVDSLHLTPIPGVTDIGAHRVNP